MGHAGLGGCAGLSVFPFSPLVYCGWRGMDQRYVAGRRGFSLYSVPCVLNTTGLGYVAWSCRRVENVLCIFFFFSLSR